MDLGDCRGTLRLYPRMQPIVLTGQGHGEVGGGAEREGESQRLVAVGPVQGVRLLTAAPGAIRRGGEGLRRGIGDPLQLVELEGAELLVGKMEVQGDRGFEGEAQGQQGGLVEGIAGGWRRGQQEGPPAC